MKLFKTTVISMIAVLFIFAACEKTELLETVNSSSIALHSDNNVITEPIALSYIHIDKKIDASAIDWNNENLSAFYGFDDTKNVYVFYSEEEMTNWIKNSKRADEVLGVIKNIKTARKYAAEIEELNNKEAEEEFEKYLEQNFGTKEKATGLFYHNVALSGNTFPISSFPKRRLRIKNDNKASSLKMFGLSMVLYSDKNWNGSSKWIWGVPLGYTDVSTLGGFNNRMSSYWNF